jgi:hypothetical protein
MRWPSVTTMAARVARMPRSVFRVSAITRRAPERAPRARRSARDTRPLPRPSDRRSLRSGGRRRRSPSRAASRSELPASCSSRASRAPASPSTAARSASVAGMASSSCTWSSKRFGRTSTSRNARQSTQSPTNRSSCAVASFTRSVTCVGGSAGAAAAAARVLPSAPTRSVKLGNFPSRGELLAHGADRLVVGAGRGGDRALGAGSLGRASPGRHPPPLFRRARLRSLAPISAAGLGANRRANREKMRACPSPAAQAGRVGEALEDDLAQPLVPLPLSEACATSPAERSCASDVALGRGVIGCALPAVARRPSSQRPHRLRRTPTAQRGVGRSPCVALPPRSGCDSATSSVGAVASALGVDEGTHHRGAGRAPTWRCRSDRDGGC